MGISASAYQSQVGLASATSANGTARNGATLDLSRVEPGTLVAVCQSSITTSSVVCTFKAQVSFDASTWYDLKSINNAANVATAAGTGSNVDTLLALEIPASASGWKFFRMVATLSGAATAAPDVTVVTYRWLKWGTLTRGG